MEFLEVPLVDDDLWKLIVRFCFNLFFLTLIVKYAIIPSQKEREFAFTAVMMNVTVFFICFSLKKLELEIGLALGLFAIFGVLRYRTDSIRAKEMTYLFIIIGIGVINALSNKKTSYAELVLVNLTIFFCALLKERIVTSSMTDSPLPSQKGPKKQLKHTVEYDSLKWLAPEDRAVLLVYLRERTGINIDRVQIQKIDLRKSTAVLMVWYDEVPPVSVEEASSTVDLPPKPPADN